MADFEVLERFEDGRQWIRFTTGGLLGRTVMAFPEPAPGVPGFPSGHMNTHLGVTPHERADRLLQSFLSEQQTSDWKAQRRFRVPSPFGALEFGRLFDIGFWPHTGGELRLCVVPTGKDLPEPDIWTNLLLALKANPSWFFTVANWWRPPNGQWNLGPVPGFETRR
jgi:hypothetical protein